MQRACGFSPQSYEVLTASTFYADNNVSISASSSLQSKGNISMLGNRKLFFDTHALVCLLEENGFTTQQSEVIVSALVKIMNTNLDMIYKDMVTKVQQEIALQQVMSHIGGVKKDMIILEKSEFSALRSENEKADNLLGCVRRAASGSREVILPLCLALVGLHLECWVQFWAPQCKGDVYILDRVQQTVTKISKGLEHLTYEERLQELRLFNLAKRRLSGDLVNIYEYLKGGYKEDRDRLFLKIKLELQQIKKQVMDEITKVRADNKLNLNLEKSRVKELYSLNERKLLEMRTEIVELHAQQDRALTQTDRKIDTEVADLKTMLESHKLDNIKYLAGPRQMNNPRKSLYPECSPPHYTLMDLLSCSQKSKGEKGSSRPRQRLKTTAQLAMSAMQQRKHVSLSLLPCESISAGNRSLINDIKYR
ncbi:hypothetical protein QYF61_011719 [Mycteria americana]|uniref:Mitochondrial calcium uniporter regulator 1 n=1 Tax=Mycteria americana TaxID=33587 RepID=A0AAN7PQK4_MYCAM|nr:hypothetical protein QYF61_011719 [Mycteria americana]